MNKCLSLIKLNWATENDLRQKTGIIYRIFNKKNGKSYIGITIHSFKERYRNKSRYRNKHLQEAIKKYGKDTFIVEIIATNKSKQELTIWEPFYIKIYESLNPRKGYNKMNSGNEYRQNMSCDMRCSMTKTQEKFIEECVAKHGNEYDYSETIYDGAFSKLKIKCKIHGFFFQTAKHHIAGSGCGKCYGSEKLTFRDFIQKAQKVHGNKYDYNFVNYVNARTKVIIKCPFHGFFYQVPDSHFRGNGCKKCWEDKLQSKILGLNQKLNHSIL